jgi:hypothetical protein
VQVCVCVCVCGCEVSLLGVCIYRCAHLKLLSCSSCYKVTDAGISLVVTHCTELRVLDVGYIKNIEGTYAVCEDPKHTLCFITMLYDILTAVSSRIIEAHRTSILLVGII